MGMEELSDELPPIPPNIWRRLLEYLQAGQTGRIALNVSEGRVLTADFGDADEHVVAETSKPIASHLE